MKTIQTLLTTLFFISTLLLLLAACEDDNDQSIVKGSDGVVIDGKIYDATDTDNYTISDAEINGDSLMVTITSSGCDGDSWETRIIDSGNIAESFPEQRYIKLELVNNEACDGIPSRKFSFNIIPLRVSTEGVILHLEGWDDSLLYEF